MSVPFEESRVDPRLGESEALERFTATGRPFNPDLASSAPQGGGFRGFSAQSVLPHRFTDDSIITVPVRRSDLDLDSNAEGSINPVLPEKTKRKSWLSRRGSADRRVKKAENEVYMLHMTRGDYLKYCAKDEKGQYVGSEPQDVGRGVLRGMVAEQSAPGYVSPFAKREKK